MAANNAPINVKVSPKPNCINCVAEPVKVMTPMPSNEMHAASQVPRLIGLFKIPKARNGTRITLNPVKNADFPVDIVCKPYTWKAFNKKLAPPVMMAIHVVFLSTCRK